MDLMTACREHVESLGVAIERSQRGGRGRLDGQPKEIRTSEGGSFTADVVIIATGRKFSPSRCLAAAFEKVHYCSVCDGTAWPRTKTLLVVGGGNSGFDDCTSRASASRSISYRGMFSACAAAQSTQRYRALHRHHQGKREHPPSPRWLPDGRCRASLRDAASGAASEEPWTACLFCFARNRIPPSLKGSRGKGYILKE